MDGLPAFGLKSGASKLIGKKTSNVHDSVNYADISQTDVFHSTNKLTTRESHVSVQNEEDCSEVDVAEAEFKKYSDNFRNGDNTAA